MKRFALALLRQITNRNLLCSFLNGRRSLKRYLIIVGSRSDGDSRMSMLFDIVAALLALGMAITWVLTGRAKLPPDLDNLRTGGTDKIA